MPDITDITDEQRSRLDDAFTPGISGSQLAREAGVQKAVALAYLKARTSRVDDGALAVEMPEDYTQAVEAFGRHVWEAAQTATVAALKATYDAKLQELGDRLVDAEAERDDALGGVVAAETVRDEALELARQADARAQEADTRAAAAEARAQQADELMRTVMADNRAMLEKLLATRA